MIFLKQKIKKSIALFFFDGSQWCGAVYVENRKSIERVALSEKINGTTFPEQLVQWAGKNGATTIRFIAAPDVLNIQFDLPENLTPEEKNTAIAWESSSTHGTIDTTGVRFGAVKAEAFANDPTGKQLFIALYSRVEFQNNRKLATKFNMIFDGEACLQFILMKIVQNRYSEDYSLLFINEHKSLIYDVNHQHAGQIIKNLPLGIASFSQQPKVWSERLKKRLSGLQSKGLIVVTPDSAPMVLMSIVKGIMPEMDVKSLSLSKLSQECMDIAATGVSNNNLDVSAITGLEAKCKRQGKLIKALFLVVVLASILAIVMWRLMLSSQVDSLQQRIKKIKSASYEHKRMNDSLNSFSTDYIQRIKMLKEISENQRIPYAVLNLLKQVSDTLPKYCCIRSIHTKDDQIIMKGSSARQKELTLFISKLQEQFELHNLKLLPNGILELAPNGTELLFTYTVVEIEGGK